MSLTFPELSPVRRTFTPGSYPTKKFEAANGASLTRLYGSRAFDATMQLEFVASDDNTTALINSWHESKGGAYTMALPSSVFSGTSSNLAGTIPTYLKWRWAEMPSVDSLFPGRSRVRVRLVATLDA
jgi:hypothetical protein